MGVRGALRALGVAATHVLQIQLVFPRYPFPRPAGWGRERFNNRASMAKPSKISGFPEWLPEQKIAEDRVIGAIKRIYESYGFVPIETPAVELLTTLGSKGVIDKEIFAVKRLRAEEGDQAELGLHFDLTVPLARYVAQHAHELAFPFKRYQIQKVWRGDRPQKGRFREFYQFDIDIIGRSELPLSCDAEVISVVGLVMNEFNVGGYELRINSRKLLAGLYEAIGLDGDARKKAIIAVDKLLKIGPEGVARELGAIPGVGAEQIDKILASTRIRCKATDLAKEVAAIGVTSELINQGVSELQMICALLPELVLENLVIDVSLARGLDYYTGVIVEVGLLKYPEFGTVISGGRYDDLASEFTDQRLPGVGVSIGLSRFMELLFSENLIDTSKKSPSQVLITVYAEEDRPHCNRVAQELRSCGVATEVYYKAPKLGKQIEYAEQRGMRYVLFIDSASKAVQVKDLSTKEQRSVDVLGEWARSIAGEGH
jgi:histidyl-tRNA synthetase